LNGAARLNGLLHLLREGIGVINQLPAENGVVFDQHSPVFAVVMGEPPDDIGVRPVLRRPLVRAV
jgi:hypothetical protein